MRFIVKVGLQNVVLFMVVLTTFTGGMWLGWTIKPAEYETIDKLRTVIKTRTLYKTITKTHIKKIYVPSEGSVEIKPKDKNKKLNDVISIKIKNKGFTRKFGIQVDFINNAYGLDMKGFFWNRLGLNGGFTYAVKGPGLALSPTAGLSYKLDRFSFIDNTEAQCTYSPLHIVGVGCGLRVNW